MNLDTALHSASMRYPRLGSGRHRTVFDMGDGYVLKLPWNFEGIYSNELEARTANDNHSSDICYARCELIDFLGVPAVKMEKVDIAPRGKLPSWTSYVDCQQVGYTTDGRLVAYDFGN